MTEPSVLKLRKFRVVELKWETRDVLTLVLAPVLPSDLFNFKSGQWAYLHLLNPDGSVLGRAAFSILSCPEESSEHLEFGVKVKGEFTQRLSNLIPDDEIAISGPFGVFCVPSAASSLVMFAGGIGITPLLSMIRSLSASVSGVDLILFYSNKTEEDIAYWEELERLQKIWPRLKVVYILTRGAPPGWAGETRRLDLAMLKSHVSNLAQKEYIVCGPAEFMQNARAMLKEAGVDESRLVCEKFTTNAPQPVT